MDEPLQRVTTKRSVLPTVCRSADAPSAFARVPGSAPREAVDGLRGLRHSLAGKPSNPLANGFASTPAAAAAAAAGQTPPQAAAPVQNGTVFNLLAGRTSAVAHSGTATATALLTSKAVASIAEGKTFNGVAAPDAAGEPSVRVAPTTAGGAKGPRSERGAHPPADPISATPRAPAPASATLPPSRKSVGPAAATSGPSSPAGKVVTPQQVAGSAPAVATAGGAGASAVGPTVAEGKKVSLVAEEKKVPSIAEGKKVSTVVEEKKVSVVAEKKVLGFAEKTVSGAAEKKVSGLAEKKVSTVAEEKKVSGIAEEKKESSIAEEKKVSTVVEKRNVLGVAEKKVSTVAEGKKPSSSEALSSIPPSNGEIQPTPVSAAPVGAAPVSAAPVSAAPVSAAPVGAAPVSAAPVSAAPVGAAPVGAAPVGAAPVGAAPVSAAPVSAAPVGAAPVGAAPVSAAPVGAAPVGAVVPSPITNTSQTTSATAASKTSEISLVPNLSISSSVAETKPAAVATPTTAGVAEATPTSPAPGVTSPTPSGKKTVIVKRKVKKIVKKSEVGGGGGSIAASGLVSPNPPAGRGADVTSPPAGEGAAPTKRIVVKKKKKVASSGEAGGGCKSPCGPDVTPATPAPGVEQPGEEADGGVAGCASPAGVGTPGALSPPPTKTRIVRRVVKKVAAAAPSEVANGAGATPTQNDGDATTARGSGVTFPAPRGKLSVPSNDPVTTSSATSGGAGLGACSTPAPAQVPSSATPEARGAPASAAAPSLPPGGPDPPARGVLSPVPIAPAAFIPPAAKAGLVAPVPTKPAPLAPAVPPAGAPQGPPTGVVTPLGTAPTPTAFAASGKTPENSAVARATQLTRKLFASFGSKSRSKGDVVAPAPAPAADPNTPALQPGAGPGTPDTGREGVASPPTCLSPARSVTFGEEGGLPPPPARCLSPTFNPGIFSPRSCLSPTGQRGVYALSPVGIASPRSCLSPSSSVFSRSPSPTSSVSSSLSLSSLSSRGSGSWSGSGSAMARRVFPQESTGVGVGDLDDREQSPVVFDAGLSFLLGAAAAGQRPSQRFTPTPAHMEPGTASAALSDRVAAFLRRSDHVADEWRRLGRPDHGGGGDLGRSKSAVHVRIREFIGRVGEEGRRSLSLGKGRSRWRRSEPDLSDSDSDRTISEGDELSEMTADLAEEHSTSTLATERLEAETAERLRLERELQEMQVQHSTLSATSERLETELLYLRAADAPSEEDEGGDGDASGVYQQRYERAARELEFTRHRLRQQHEDDLEQLVALKKQLEKKLADAYEEVQEQRQVAGQWKRKVQKLQAETNDLRLLSEEQTSRNALLEKKQRKFDAEFQLLQEQLRQEKQQKERSSREREIALGEKYTLEQNHSALRLELELKEEQLGSLQRELDELVSGGHTDLEVASLKRSKNELEKKLQEQEEELDDLAGQLAMLGQAKLRLEMTLEQQRKEARREAAQRDEELDDVRCNAVKKVKALEAQLESEHEERTQLVREKHELERRASAAEDAAGRSRADRELVARLRRDLRRARALLRDAQMAVQKNEGDSSARALVRQLRNQLEDAELTRASAVKARQTAEAELSEAQAQLEEATRGRGEAEERAAGAARQAQDLRTQLDENEEEMAEVLKKYRSCVQQLTSEQLAQQEQAAAVAQLEQERTSLREQLAELTARLECAETLADPGSSLAQRKLELKTREMESRLELEQTTRARLEVQIGRLKEAVEKLQSEASHARAKEAAALAEARRTSRAVREARDEAGAAGAREAEAVQRRKDAETRLEAAQAEALAARADLRLALTRVSDLQAAMQDEDGSQTESDHESESDESIESFLVNNDTVATWERARLSPSRSPQPSGPSPTSARSPDPARAVGDAASRESYA